jgi:hypothetical protein
MPVWGRVSDPSGRARLDGFICETYRYSSQRVPAEEMTTPNSTAEGGCPHVAGGYFLAFAVSFSPTRLLTSNFIFPARLSESTTMWSPCSTSPSRIFIASGSCTSF